MKNLTPNASLNVVIQISDDKRFLYYGYMHITKERVYKFFCCRKKLDKEFHDKLASLKNQVNDIKSNLNSPYLIDK